MGEHKKKKKTNPQKWLVRIEEWSLLSKWSVMVNAVMVAEFASQTLISVHLHLFRSRLRLLASLCVSLPFCSLLGCRAVVSSTFLVIHFRGLLYCGHWPVDHWVAYIFHFLVSNKCRVCVGRRKSADLITANERKNCILKNHSRTCIFAMMSATLTTGSWVIASLLCAFILLFIQPMLSFTHFSTVLISSGLKCRYRSSWERICDKKVNL